MIIDYLYCSICGEMISEDIYPAVPVRTRGVCCEKCYNGVVKVRVKRLIDAVMTGEIPDIED